MLQVINFKVKNLQELLTNFMYIFRQTLYYLYMHIEKGLVVTREVELYATIINMTI